MQPSMYDYVLEHLEAARGRWSQVAEEAGVSKRTLEKIARREIEDPGVSHIQKLYDHFQRETLGEPRATRQ